MNENFEKIFNNSTKMPIVVGLVSFAVGTGVGFGVSYILNRKNTPEEITRFEIPKQALLSTEAIDETIIDVATEDQDGDELLDTDVATDEPVNLGREFVQSKLNEEVLPILPPEAEPLDEPTTRNIFAGTDSEWNYEKELEKRSADEPYILHRDEFYADELDYTQLTLTYYAGDDILVDDEETPVYNHNNIVGPIRFGHGSGDPNVFYVRNDKRKAEYEILNDPGSYSREVLGLTAEDNARASDLRHSNHVPKFIRD